jgi:hypothetical protein
MTVFGFLWLISHLPADLKYASMLLWGVLPWKVAAIAPVRNRLMDTDQPLAASAESFRFASHVAVDLFLGIATALGPALLAAYMVFVLRWNSPFGELGLYLAGSLLLALTAEIAIGWLFFGVLRSSWLWDNPFLEQQKARWRRSEKIAQSKPMGVSNIGNLLPSLPEIRRALLISLTMPFLIVLGAK